MNTMLSQDRKALAPVQQNNPRGVMYKLDFPNGKSYIGVTKRTVNQRFAKHCNDAKRENFAISRAINKHGKDNIKVNTLVLGSMDYLFELEKSAIKSFNTRSPNGYNLTDGGEGSVGRVLSEESRNKISKSLKGHAVRPSTLEKMRLASTGRKHSPESIQKMLGQRAGIPRSEEVKAKISAKNKGKVMSLEQRKFLSDLAKSKWEKIKAMGDDRPRGKGFKSFKKAEV